MPGTELHAVDRAMNRANKYATLKEKMDNKQETGKICKMLERGKC